MKLIFTLFLTIFVYVNARSSCDSLNTIPLSNRVANYTIQLTLDDEAKMANANQLVRWVNSSPEPVKELRFYMYLNAFKNARSTFLRDGRFFFGEDLNNRKTNEWGWIDITSLTDISGRNLMPNMQFIQPDDGNEDDQTVLQIILHEAVMSGDTLLLNMDFSAKLPKTFVRAGYSKDNFHLFVHWFPQLGVYEANDKGKWHWNCHQFHSRTEFYADFGEYHVEITANENLKIGATGCLSSEVDNGNGTRTFIYTASDVIDFAWVAYPYFKVYKDNWNGVDIELLIPPEHNSLRNRYMKAIKQSLDFLSDYIAPYPYPKITIVDPPLHALRSGLMEYPMFITCGSFAFMPKGIRTLESLVVHEFSHQYFMGILASNEKEEAWLDEGFVTFFEDKIMDNYYGVGRSVFSVLGLKIGNSQLSRSEYINLPDPNIGTIARPGWEFGAEYKALVYSKTATILRTLEALVGDDLMKKIIQNYYQTWKFRHPGGEDFLEVVDKTIQKSNKSNLAGKVNAILRQGIYEAKSCDYKIESIEVKDKAEKSQQASANITNKDLGDCISTIKIHRYGYLEIPVEVEVYFENGNKILEYLSGTKSDYELCYTNSKVVAAYIDPLHKNPMDLNLINNSMSVNASRIPKIKYVMKSVFWVQNLLQSIGTLL